MKTLKTLCSAMLLVSLLALAGCPGIAQQGDNSGSSQSSSSGAGD